MKATNARRQGGLTFANFLLIAILVVFVALMGMKIIPAYVEDRTIRSILETIAHDSEMQEAAPNVIRESFDKRAMMNNITVVNANDIAIQKTPAGMILSVSYKVKIGLFGNASLLLEFETSSSRPR